MSSACSCRTGPSTWRSGSASPASAASLRCSTPTCRGPRSRTPGRPKAARVSHARLMQWSHWFAGMMDTRASDRMYNCLPMYHSVGGVLATGAVLVGGGSVVIRDKFSARQFWPDVIRWDCTLFQYIGELCRYLLHTEPAPHETQHGIRLACGNGLRPDVWNDFKTRFRIPRILEFYASTEGNVSMVNVEGKPGAIGRIPAFLAHRFPAALVRFDVARNEPVRNEAGFCVRCAPDEVGEAIGQVLEAIGASPAVREAHVYGVALPGTDGRAGMAALVADAGAGLDLAAFRAHLVRCLPDYARPLFLRIRSAMDVTATFKHTKSESVRQGYDPAGTDDAIYFDDPDRHAFVRLDQTTYDRIQRGRIRW